MFFLVFRSSLLCKIYFISLEKEEIKAEEGGVVFSICSYSAETDDALNLVEGERVYIIGRFSTIFLLFLLNSRWLR